MQITAFIPIVLVSRASMLKFTGVGQSIVISKTQSKPIGFLSKFFVKICFRNMYRDHGSSVNAYRAVSIEPARYNGHLRVSVWFFPQLEINRCPCQTCNTRKLEGKFLPPSWFIKIY